MPIPLVDRGKGDPRNLIGVILDRDENDLYRIAVSSGVLKGHFSRNQFDLCKEQLYRQEDMNTSVEVSFRQAVQKESMSGGHALPLGQPATARSGPRGDRGQRAARAADRGKQS